jgi:hypothetical protein
MTVYVFIKKKRGGDEISTYGSVKALMLNENVIIGGSVPTYNRLMYLLGSDHYYRDKKLTIKKCTLKKSKQKL